MLHGDTYLLSSGETVPDRKQGWNGYGKWRRKQVRKRQLKNTIDMV